MGQQNTTLSLPIITLKPPSPSFHYKDILKPFQKKT